MWVGSAHTDYYHCYYYDSVGIVRGKKECMVCECIVVEVCVDIEVRVSSLGSVSGKEDCIVCDCMAGWVCEDFKSD